MNREQIISGVKAAFGGTPRPTQFVRGTCRCDECCEHDADMQGFTSDDLPLDKLARPAWDPISFASNEAVAYLMPGLAVLALYHTETYVQQFIFHIGQPERLSSFTPDQARALTSLLDYLVLHETTALDRHRIVDELFGTREKLDRIATGTSR